VGEISIACIIFVWLVAEALNQRGVCDQLAQNGNVNHDARRQFLIVLALNLIAAGARRGARVVSESQIGGRIGELCGGLWNRVNNYGRINEINIDEGFGMSV
jgi:hypothetical protein